MSEVLINKVAESGIVTINLEDYFPGEAVMGFDLKQFLFMELILKEKDYREALKQFNWDVYAGKIVAVHCSADAIIPMWAYMLAAAYLQPLASQVIFGSTESVTEQILLKNIQDIDVQEYSDKRVVIKGCGDLPVKESAYLKITVLLRPVVKSIMYGEPCSTVPIYKQSIKK